MTRDAGQPGMPIVGRMGRWLGERGCADRNRMNPHECVADAGIGFGTSSQQSASVPLPGWSRMAFMASPLA